MKSRLLSYLLLAVGLAAFAAVCVAAWQGRLGWWAMGLLALVLASYSAARRSLDPPFRAKSDFAAKLIFTVAGLMALLRHPIEAEGQHLPIYNAILLYVNYVDPATFAQFALIAMIVKFSGVITSAYAWHLLLVGQGVRFPFWSQVMTAFLIGRFIGTFLPSTLGLDGYTLYEAGRYSNQWARCVTAKLLEKVIGITGLFLSMLITLPFGYGVIREVTAGAGRPEAAPLLAGAIFLIAGGVLAVVVVGLVWPRVLTTIIEFFGRLLPDRIGRQVLRFTVAVGAYRGQVGLLLLALLSKFNTHFTTAAVYYFTALAIGVATAEFWPIVFGSTIQILATVLSPTIAGEGAREAFQALLLSAHLGGIAQAVLSAALGFLAAEAATLWGGAFLWFRTERWRPAFVLVDGTQVDYHWLHEEDVDRRSPTAGPQASSSPAAGCAGSSLPR